LPRSFFYYLIEFLVIYYFAYHLVHRTRETLLFLPFKILVLLFILGGFSNLLGFRELNLFWKLVSFGYVGAVLVAFSRKSAGSTPVTAIIERVFW
jgi:hypothetical protein